MNESTTTSNSNNSGSNLQTDCQQLMIQLIESDSCQSRIEALLAEHIHERKHLDNALKRLWIFSHLTSSSCSDCHFYSAEEREEYNSGAWHTFRIKTKCMSKHFQVSRNTPFNWLVRDFQRLHAAHSAEVPHRKDLREVFYDEFNYFHPNMSVQDFVDLAVKLNGRLLSLNSSNTGKRKRMDLENTMEDHYLRSLNGNHGTLRIGNRLASSSLPVLMGPQIMTGSHSVHTTHPPYYSLAELVNSPNALNAVLPIVQEEEHNSQPRYMQHYTTQSNTQNNTSRLVLELKVSNITFIFMRREKLQKELTKADPPFELPTFRPEFGVYYEIGRRDERIEDEEQINHNKLFIEDIRISRTHAIISYNNDGWSLTNKSASNGTSLVSTVSVAVKKDGIESVQEVKQVRVLGLDETVLIKQGNVIHLGDMIATLTVVDLLHKQEPSYNFTGFSPSVLAM